MLNVIVAQLFFARSGSTQLDLARPILKKQNPMCQASLYQVIYVSNKSLFKILFLSTAQVQHLFCTQQLCYIYLYSFGTTNSACIDHFIFIFGKSEKRIRNIKSRMEYYIKAKACVECSTRKIKWQKNEGCQVTTILIYQFNVTSSRAKPKGLIICSYLSIYNQ